MTGNCSELDSESSFAAYVALMRNVTSQDLSRDAMFPCRQQICSVLYGVGNPDISGVGVLVGYALELVLGVSLSIALLSLGMRRHNSSRLQNMISRSFDTYADAAVLLSFSIQLASLVILVKKDFGISAADFGSLTVEVTWAAALLTMLPMTILCYIHKDVSGREGQLEDRRDLRMILACISWCMFLYTFVSRMVANYGPSQIGVPQSGAPPPVLSVTEANNITMLCYQGQESLSASENTIFQVFALGGSLFVSMAIVGALVWALMERFDNVLFNLIRQASIATWMPPKAAKEVLIAFVVVWSVPQLWAIIRFRSMQQALAVSIASADRDNSWSFGQIVAVTVFLPVFIEFGFVYLRWTPGSSKSSSEEAIEEANEAAQGAELTRT